jgi:hypothetical protein
VRELVVGIFMIERYDAFVGIKDVPAQGKGEKMMIKWMRMGSGTLI